MTNDIMHVDDSITFETLDELLDAIAPEEPEESFEDDYASNAPCDFSGLCAGASCPYFFKCQGKS